MNKTRPIIFILLFLTFTSIQPIVWATESSTSAEVDEETINKNIKERIQKVTNKSVVENTPEKKAIVGTIQSVTNNSISIKTKEESRQISFEENTSFIRNPGNKTVDISDLAIDDHIIAMGLINGSEILESKRIVVSSDTPKPVNKTSAIGSIISINTRQKTIEIRTPDGQEISLKVSKGASLEIIEDNQRTTTTLAELVEEQKIVVVYNPSDDEDESASLLSLLAISQTNDSELESDEASISPSPTPVTRKANPTPKALEE